MNFLPTASRTSGSRPGRYPASWRRGSDDSEHRQVACSDLGAWRGGEGRHPFSAMPTSAMPIFCSFPAVCPGAKNIDEHEGVRRALVAQNAAGRRIGAICAGPMVLGHLGLLDGRRATCYPGFEKELAGATYTAEPFTVDGNIVTGKGPVPRSPTPTPYLKCSRVSV